MPRYGTAFGRGLAIGAGAAFVYTAARETGPLLRSLRRTLPGQSSDSSPSRLIDWEWAARLAIRAAGPSPTLHPTARERLQEEYGTLLREIERPIADYTGNQLSLANTEVSVMDRLSWVHANMASFRELLQPVEDLYGEQAAAGRGELRGSLLVQQGARALLTAEMGLLVGYLARRVLGQYDLAMFGPQPAARGKLYFVEPNLRQVEASLNVPRDDLRRWVALHEATHAHEFELHPWVRPYLNGSLQRYLRLLVDDIRRHQGESTLVVLASRLAANVRRGHGLLGALMTPEQRELIGRLQTLMSLAEGYSNHVMNVVGRAILPNFQRIHDRVEHRQQERSQAELLFLRVTGLSMKMEQYRRGEQFVDEVARTRSIVFANQAWESPERLPSEAELLDPGRWIQRMEASAG